VLEAAGRESLAGKIIVDVALPLDFSRGMPPSLGVCKTDSLGEQIQRAFPDARVVKTLNTMNAAVMTEPVGGEVFVCGDDADAKREVTALLVTFGWPAEHVVDLGVISAARGTEMYLPLWLSLYGALGTGQFNIAVVGRTP
jgi:predicted dinucleotide-binding enzyme